MVLGKSNNAQAFIRPQDSYIRISMPYCYTNQYL